MDGICESVHTADMEKQTTVLSEKLKTVYYLQDPHVHGRLLHLVLTKIRLKVLIKSSLQLLHYVTHITGLC
jgi:hypothetical protein